MLFLLLFLICLSAFLRVASLHINNFQVTSSLDSSNCLTFPSSPPLYIWKCQWALSEWTQVIPKEWVPLTIVPPKPKSCRVDVLLFSVRPLAVFEKRVLAVPHIITMEIKSCACVFGRQGTSYSWLSGFRGLCHVPKQNSLSGVSLLFSVAIGESVQAFRNRAFSQFSTCGEITDRTRAK